LICKSDCSVIIDREIIGSHPLTHPSN